ncbi:SusC/RagA family TonB-linked outer membrane protein [Parabacteroides sp. OttesenSCG-928-K15]|nr:SusC/RagA family TonB-linked outer membrane protein [Parabacteroides sp. OttesenSCG-928-K15]
MKKNLLQFCNQIKQHELTHLIRTMKLTTLFLFVITIHVFAIEAHAQNAKVSISKNTLPLSELITEIEKQTNYLFVYSDTEINTSMDVNVNAKNKSVGEVLNQALRNKGIMYDVAKNYISLRLKKENESFPVPDPMQAKKIKLTGTVLDQNNEPVIGANIVLKGAKLVGSVTDINGAFSLEVPENGTLLVSYIGYRTVEVAVNSQSTLSIQLIEDSEALEEVVVTALGIRREEKALGYAVQKVSGDKLSTVKSVDIGTALTGKVAGLNITNSTEFNEAPSFSLRGETPLVVVDGVPYSNINMRDIAPDDIASIDVLKGAPASALYGSRGGKGAIMITTKRGEEEGLNIQINSSTMFESGFLRIPKVQTSYSTGMNGKYDPEDFIWGDKLDIGRTAVQWDPHSFEWREMPLESKGKNNFKNFLEFSFVTNNNISVTQKGKYGSFRTSLTHVYNKGQYPNTKLNKLTYTVAGDMKWNNFTFEGGITYNKRFYPNNYGTGYGKGGYIYNLLVWTGTDLDIRDYKNYWVDKDERQSWPNEVWYDNPYFIANEIIHSSDYDIMNAFLSTSYSFTPWLKASLRTGADVYSERQIWRNPINSRGGWHKKGYYEERQNRGFSINNDLMINASHKFGDFSLDGYAGGTLYFYQDDHIGGNTRNGLSIPGYYSLKASVDPAGIYSSLSRKQMNSLFAKASFAWKSTLFLDVTARNDWSSTLPSETRSYFYPSVSGSVVMSEFIPMPKWIGFWKVLASWTQTKQDLGVYDNSTSYSISTNLWDGMNGAYHPTSMKDPNILPSATRSYEIGTTLNMFSNRLRFDFVYFDKLFYNQTYYAPISDTSGFEYSLINIDEERVRRGVEITIGGDVIQNKDFNWNAQLNWSSDRYTYAKIDPVYSSQRDWVGVGKRVDYYTYRDWDRDPNGNIIHQAGLPRQSEYQSVAGYSNPDWIFGLNNTFRYKDFTLQIAIDGRFGGIAHSVTSQALWMTGAHIDSDTPWRYEEVVNGNRTFVGEGVTVVSGSVDRDVNGNITRDDRVFGPNETATSYEGYMKLYNGAGNVWDPKHQHLLDQSFIKLRSLSLTYNLPKSINEKLRLKGASVSFIGNNLFMWTKEFKYSDPDKSSENLNSPSLRMIGCNIKLNF